MTSKERKLENRSVSYAEKFDFEHIKLDRAKRAWPDRAFFGEGAAVHLVEFKIPGEDPRPDQDALHRRLEALGFTVHVVDDYQQFCDLVDGWVRGQVIR